jgi:endonuclease-3 related protein
MEIYEHLEGYFGPQHWWPAETPFEVIIGAILTQSAAWRNVEKAINNLKEAGVLSPEALRRLSLKELGALIKPCGYYNSKAIKIKAFVDWLGLNYGDDLNSLFAEDTPELRQKLLSVHGIGEETADSIILYAADKPVFVIDAYTKRIFSRMGLLPENVDYSRCREFFMSNLPQDALLYNEYHALLVALGKKFCRKQPLCVGCPLSGICRAGRQSLEKRRHQDSVKL